MQRIFDIFFAGIALVLLSPLLLPLMFILRVTGEGEIFFPQNRVGRGGKHFKLYKFATMLKDSPNMDTGTVTVKNDPRILPMGGFLRKTFPDSAQIDITNVRPGLSGIGSVVFRSEEDMMHANADPDRLYDDVIMPYKGKLESWYIRNNSVWNYLLLIALTILVILTRSTRLIFRCYSSLPRPPEALESFISSDYYE